MANITVQGLASGLPADLVDKLVALQQEPLTRLADKKVTQQTRLQAVQDLNAKLLALKSAMEGLDARSDYQLRTVTSSDEATVSATASADAAVGTYTLSNVVLAQADQKRHTAGVASRTDPLAPGTFAFTYGGGTEQEVSISGGETLSDLVTKINDLEAGVSASILNDGTSDYLVLSGDSTGAGKTIQITANTTIAGFEAPDFTDTSTEQDASFDLNGLTITGSSNTFSGTLTGLTISLLKATGAGDSVTVGVQRDGSGLSDRIQSFVDAYNTLEATLQDHSTYDASTGSRTILFGDPAVRSLQFQLRSILSKPIAGLSGTFGTLAELGITTNKDSGTLEIDSAKLQSALATDFEGVGKLFYGDTATGVQGYAAQLASYLTQVTNPVTGVMQGKTDAIEGRIRALDSQIQSTQRQVDIASQRIKDQFASLDQLIADLNSRSSGALQTLQNLNNSGLAILQPTRTRG
jgi:flagellar hook-associated protein 2